MNDKMDIIFSPTIEEAPKLLISMKKINHVYFGLYKGFDKRTLKEVVRYFWAEHNNDEQSFFRCLVTKDQNMTFWTLDAIANNLITPIRITSLQKEVLEGLTSHMKSFVNKDGILIEKFRKAMNEVSSPLLIIKEESDADFSAAEHHIIATLNATWRLDSNIQFEFHQ